MSKQSADYKNIKVRNDLHKKLKIEGAKRGVEMNTLVQEMFDMYLSDSSTGASVILEVKAPYKQTNQRSKVNVDYFRDSLRAHLLLEIIHRAGIEPFRAAIDENLEAFAACSEVVLNSVHADANRSHKLPQSTDALESRIESLIQASQKARKGVETSGSAHSKSPKHLKAI